LINAELLFARQTALPATTDDELAQRVLRHPVLASRVTAKVALAVWP
jgi:hypothetical protein